MQTGNLLARSRWAPHKRATRIEPLGLLENGGPVRVGVVVAGEGCAAGVVCRVGGLGMIGSMV